LGNAFISTVRMEPMRCVISGKIRRSVHDSCDCQRTTEEEFSVSGDEQTNTFHTVAHFKATAEKAPTIQTTRCMRPCVCHGVIPCMYCMCVCVECIPQHKCTSHPERVVLLGQVGQDGRVEDHHVQEATPKRGQLGAELADVPTDLLRYLLMAVLQLFGWRRERERGRESGREIETEREREREKETERDREREREN